MTNKSRRRLAFSAIGACSVFAATMYVCFSRRSPEEALGLTRLARMETAFFADWHSFLETKEEWSIADSNEWPALVRWLRSGSILKRACAYQALEAFAGEEPRLLDTLAAMPFDPERTDPVELLGQLGWQHPERSIKLLQKVYGSGSGDRRAKVVLATGSLEGSGANAVSWLLELVRDKQCDLAIRRNALQSAFDIAGAIDDDEIELINAVVKVGSDALDDDDLAYTAVWTSGGLRNRGEPLVAKLRTCIQNEDTGPWAIVSLGAIGPAAASAAAEIAEQLRSSRSDYLLHSNCLTALEAIGTSSPEVIEVIADDLSEYEYAFRALQTLGALGPAAATELSRISDVLANASKSAVSREEVFRCEAARTIGRIAANSTLGHDSLLLGCIDEAPSVRATCLRIIAQLGMIDEHSTRIATLALESLDCREVVAAAFVLRESPELHARIRSRLVKVLQSQQLTADDFAGVIAVLAEIDQLRDDEVARAILAVMKSAVMWSSDVIQALVDAHVATESIYEKPLSQLVRNGDVSQRQGSALILVASGVIDPEADQIAGRIAIRARRDLACQAIELIARSQEAVRRLRPVFEKLRHAPDRASRDAARRALLQIVDP